MALRQGLGFKNEIYLKSSPPELLGSGDLNFAYWSFPKLVQIKATGSKFAPHQGVVGTACFLLFIDFFCTLTRYMSRNKSYDGLAIFNVFWLSEDSPTGQSEKKKKKEADRRRGRKTISKSGQEWTMPTQLGQLKTGQDGKGLLRIHLRCPYDLPRLRDRLE